VSVPAGVARMNFWQFSVYTFAGSFLWNGFLAYAGFLLGENWEQLREYTRPFDIPILVLLVILAAWVIFRRLRTLRDRSRAPGGPSGIGSKRD
jgi:membrane protein DedA with SNARE-associated domain